MGHQGCFSLIMALKKRGAAPSTLCLCIRAVGCWGGIWEHPWGDFGKHPTLGNLSMCFFPFPPCSKTCGVDKQEKLLGLVLLSTPRGCTQLQHPKFLLALGRGVQHPNKGGFGVGRSSATPLTLLALLCSYRKRRGAINSKQLTYLEKYRPKQRLRFKDPHNHKNKCCIM